ncbi:hypothetical protein LX36DRAFT_322881 [Colletotrichum falcatum]|nr:hypothetical protein LX36DRAFT_322881 [Colletotrichum falcatum]
MYRMSSLVCDFQYRRMPLVSLLLYGILPCPSAGSTKALREGGSVGDAMAKGDQEDTYYVRVQRPLIRGGFEVCDSVCDSDSFMAYGRGTGHRGCGTPPTRLGAEDKRGNRRGGKAYTRLHGQTGYAFNFDRQIRPHSRLFHYVFSMAVNLPHVTRWSGRSHLQYHGREDMNRWLPSLVDDGQLFSSSFCLFLFLPCSCNKMHASRAGPLSVLETFDFHSFSFFFPNQRVDASK